MADLSTLIRLHKHELDDKRQKLGQLYVSLEGVLHHRRILEETFAREKEMAKHSDAMQVTLTSYIDKVNRQRAEMDDIKIQLEKRIAEAKDSMMDTFSELKKYEMTQAERDRLAAEERALKESNMMDEIGLEGFRRQHDRN